jgi:hypothetical protein
MQSKKIETVTSPFILPTSRYYKSRAFMFSESTKMTLETYKRVITPVSSSDRYTILSGKYQYRPDLLSQDTYGMTDLWWLILEANQIFDIFDFTAGLNIRIPGTITSMVK